jgi:hypothetical protein
LASTDPRRDDGPKSISVSPGSRYAVVLEGFDEKKPTWFLVEFF